MICLRQLIAICFTWAFIVQAAAVSPPDFNRDIAPLIAKRCLECHNKRDVKGDVNLTTKVAFTKGTENGRLALELVTKGEMPPKIKGLSQKLPDSEISLLKAWVDSGAAWPGGRVLDLYETTTDVRAGRDWWSLQPVERPVVPRLAKQPIDAFILAKLKRESMEPAPHADRRTLARRAYFDLTGLPPTPEQLEQFIGDSSPDAWPKLIDKLLASPRYGERWSRYWLDLVRFAETDGYERDKLKPNIWRYRDWVIRAFNDNLGYDDFVRYQLAGDLFPDATNDQLVATGFSRLHLIIDRGTALPAESFFKNVVDRVTAVGTAFMGMTVHCATCHEHKYDPLTQKDFYSLFAFFNNIDAAPETNGGPKNGLQPPVLALATSEQKRKLQLLDKQIAVGLETSKALKTKVAAEKDPQKKKAFARELEATTARNTALKGMRDRLDREILRAMVMKERKEVRPTHIRIRGQYDVPGELVERNTPGFLPPLKKSGKTATRLDLAEWFVDPGHPLTARVAVNRFWQQFFGTGLVKTSEDLGTQGEVPIHPVLLDHLAVSFIESGWNVKALVRQIVTSRTYRQSSVSTPDQFATDPENRMLARGSRFRMDAEMIRDQILATSGLLVNTMYGKSVKPPQPDGLWKSVTMIGERFKADTGAAIYRRSLYTYWKRGMPPPQMTILNAPIRDACIARRERTNTPSQTLLLLNESEYLGAARELARIVLGTKEMTGAQRLAFAYETVTSKLPDEKERQILSDLLLTLQKSYLEQPALADEICSGLNLGTAKKRAQLAAWTVLVNALYNLDITKTRE